jgi:xanthine dehydrogenase accessory factor
MGHFGRVGVEPSYRTVGAAMVFHDGTVRPGCIEELHAKRCEPPTRFKLSTSSSPFMDIQLPCGGGLEV